METCIRCDVSSKDVRLFDAIYEGRMAVICERCSIIENIPIIKKPDVSQLKESESGVGVYDRMKIMAGIKESKRDDTFFQEDRLRELNNNPQLELPEKEHLKLINNFQWEIMNNRRRKGLTQQKLAETIGESETAIQMIEKGRLPENAGRLIKKLEQFFQTRLKKISERELMMKAREKPKEPILLDDEGNILDIIPEEKPYVPEVVVEGGRGVVDGSKWEEWVEKPEVECKIEQFDDEKRKMTCGTVPGTEAPRQYIDEARDLDLRRIDPKSVRISDLKEIHKKKVEVTRQEQIEEQRKIEERQRILEALREKDRFKQEREKQDKILKIKKEEQERQRLIEMEKRKLNEQREKQSREIDRFLGGVELLNENEEEVEEFDREFRL